jgi:transposase InsO family protein
VETDDMVDFGDYGLYEPTVVNKNCDFIAASGLVHIDKENIIPIRLMTVHDDVNLKKGTIVGNIGLTNVKERRNVGYLRAVAPDINNYNKWEKLGPIFENEFKTLPISERKKLKQMLKEYVDIFSCSKNDIGRTNVVEHNIETGAVPPIACRRGRIPLGLEGKVDEMIKDFEEKGIIQPSKSPWNAPLVVVPKKDGNIRITVDYRQLNSITKRPIFPIPDTTELMDSLSGSVYFSTLDFRSGYYNIPMNKCDIEKTAFSTQRNHYEFLRMPMGLSTAPATFQRLMHTVFREENWQKCLIYLDDVLVFSKTLEEQINRLRIIFDRIREAGLKLAPEKCHFLQTSVSYLGHVVSKEGIFTDKSKIDKILSWPQPQTEEDLRSFLGLCGYYRRFIKDYAQLVIPLEKLCNTTWNKKTRKKKTEVTFEPNHEEAFMKLKKTLTSPPVLAFPTAMGKFILDTDASHDTIGAVLSQLQNGQEKVIAYASKRMTQSQRQYCITRKELFSVYYFVTYFKNYLLGRNFVVRTDHRALCWMLDWKTPNTSQYCRWKQELELYDMDVQYRKGSQHGNADSLSRYPSCGQCELKHLDPKRKKNVKSLNNKRVEVHCRRMVQLESDINQENDKNLKTIIDLLKCGRINEKYPDELRCQSEETKHLWGKRENLRFRGGLLYLKKEDSYKLLIPNHERRELIRSTHNNLAHVGVTKTYNMLKEAYYWNNMELDTRLVIGDCKHCARRKNAPQKKHNDKKLVAGFPFEKISIDLAGPLPPGENGEKYILGIIDNFSRFIALVPLKHGTATEVAKALMKNWICLFGTPGSIHSDRGTEFNNKLLERLCEMLGIKKTNSAPYYPRGNSMIERLFKTAKDLLYATTESFRKKWTEVLPLVERALRCTKQRITNFSPYEIIFGRTMSPFIMPVYNKHNYKSIPEYLEYIQQVSKRIHEKMRQNNEIMSKDNVKPFATGDRVMAKTLPCKKGIQYGRYEGPYIIIACLGKWTYRLKHCGNNKVIERNYYHLKKAEKLRTSDITEDTTIESVTKGMNASVKSVAKDNNEIRRELNLEDGILRRYPRRGRQAPDRYGFDIRR